VSEFFIGLKLANHVTLGEQLSLMSLFEMEESARAAMSMGDQEALQIAEA
jgi:hypothetical protein